ncbi:MAG: cytochrome c [Acidobacteria bacterium]|nr:cytochrome c [Acidobacteriota bacterium]
MNAKQRRTLMACGFAAALLVAGCRQDMHDQPKFKPYAKSDFYADQRSARPLVDGTVARGHLHDDTLLYTGKAEGKPAEVFPFEITAAVMDRGRERFDIYCSPCHGRAGVGDGMIVRRGYRRPPTFHQDRLRQAAPGYVFDVITNGFGAMPDYAGQVPVPDRWAIVAYVKALQRSQQATVADVPAADRARLEAGDKR